MWIGLLIIIIVLSWALTWAIRRYALAKQIMDIPNHRSSHVVATPRGGGLAFVICFLLAIPLLSYWNLMPRSISLSFIGAGGLVALIGFLDDWIQLATRWRFMGHIAAGILALYGLGGMPSIAFFGWFIPPGLLANGLAIVYLCWLLNLYNFMDGIDGIAGVEAISACLGAAGLYWLNGDLHLMVLPLVLGAAVAGFLCWNFPPARIFMGDAGSGFLGFIFGLLAIYAAQIQPQYFWCWLILLGVFVVDATLTLFRRLCRGEKIYEAHRSHAYQHAARLFQGHLPVTGAVLIINSVWLWPLALVVGLGHLEPLIGVLIAYLPLAILGVHFKAGRPD